MSNELVPTSGGAIAATASLPVADIGTILGKGRISQRVGSYEMVRLNGKIVVNRILENGEFREVDIWEKKDIENLLRWLNGE